MFESFFRAIHRVIKPKLCPVCLPTLTSDTAPRAVVRRAVAINAFHACHIAPSHRRYPHPLWMDSFSLIADLLLGCGVGRYLGCLHGPAFDQVVALRGFSAGSFSGLCLLHILWPIPGVVTKGRLGAIACPPALLTMGPAKEGDELYLVHYAL